MKKRLALIFIGVALMVLSCGCVAVHDGHNHETSEPLPSSPSEQSPPSTEETRTPIAEVVDLSPSTGQEESSLSEDEKTFIKGVAETISSDIIEGKYNDIIGDESHIELFRIDTIRFAVVPYTEEDGISHAEALVIRDAPLKDGKRSAYKFTANAMTLVCTDGEFINEVGDEFRYLIEQYPNLPGNAIGLMLENVVLQNGERVAEN